MGLWPGVEAGVGSKAMDDFLISFLQFMEILVENDVDVLNEKRGLFFMPDNSRIQRERKTVQAMIRMFCIDHHSHQSDLCPNCGNLASYADRRLDLCPFGEGKTTCAQCPVHCYTPEMREKIRLIMRYSGPKMIRRHPILAIRHLADGLRKIPLAKKKRSKNAA
jgi:hypothetical protein